MEEALENENQDQFENMLRVSGGRENQMDKSRDKTDAIGITSALLGSNDVIVEQNEEDEEDEEDEENPDDSSLQES
jgi:hypothetical protein